MDGYGRWALLAVDAMAAIAVEVRSCHVVGNKKVASNGRSGVALEEPVAASATAVITIVVSIACNEKKVVLWETYVVGLGCVSDGFRWYQ